MRQLSCVGGELWRCLRVVRQANPLVALPARVKIPRGTSEARPDLPAQAPPSSRSVDLESALPAMGRPELEYISAGKGLRSVMAGSSSFVAPNYV